MGKEKESAGRMDIPPKELLDNVSTFLHIRNTIENLWGSTELHTYFDRLFSDTRGHTRKGFPPAVGLSLIKLSILHSRHLESMGIKLIHLEGSEFASKVHH